MIAQNYAATGKTRDLTTEDLAKAEVEQYNRSVESSVVHYGDTTLTFLNNWYRADQEGNALTYVSAVAVEEKSVIDYNTGNPDGVLDPGEEPRPPRIPLVALYPKEGHALLGQPVLRARRAWVSAEERDGALAFQDFVQQPENQQRVLEFNFRPGNPEVPIAAPIIAENGVDPNQPQTLLQVPHAAGDGRAARPMGRAAQGRPGAARHRRVGIDEGTGRIGRARDQARSRQAGRQSTRSTTSSRTISSACACSRPVWVTALLPRWIWCRSAR